MIQLIKAGFYTTIQDAGRFGYREMGVPISGAMDEISFTRANKLLENPKNAPALEITLIGPKIEFLEETYFTISGAIFDVFLNQNAVKNLSVYEAKKGDVLTFSALKKGCRAYLAVKNGFKSTKKLNSSSFYHPITPFRLENNAIIPFAGTTNFTPKILEWSFKNDILNQNTLEVYKGPEFELFNDEQISKIQLQTFTISNNSNRMGYRLNESIGEHSHSIITSSTLPGTVQCTPNGKLIVLMKDAQVTGGYPRILQLTDESVAILAQKKTNDVVRLKFSNLNLKEKL